MPPIYLIEEHPVRDPQLLVGTVRLQIEGLPRGLKPATFGAAILGERMPSSFIRFDASTQSARISRKRGPGHRRSVIGVRLV